MEDVFVSKVCVYKIIVLVLKFRVLIYVVSDLYEFFKVFFVVIIVVYSNKELIGYISGS